MSQFAICEGILRDSQLVLAPMAPTDDDVEAFVHLREQLLDVGRIVLQVTVHGNEDGAAGMLDAGSHGGSLPVIAAKLDHAHARIAARQSHGARERGVLAAVVHQNDLECNAQRLDGSDDGPVERVDVGLLIEQRNNHR